jgi:hypothetical protein
VLASSCFGVISGKFNLVRISTSENCAHKWISNYIINNVLFLLALLCRLKHLKESRYHCKFVFVDGKYNNVCSFVCLLQLTCQCLVVQVQGRGQSCILHTQLVQLISQLHLINILTHLIPLLVTLISLQLHTHIHLAPIMLFLRTHPVTQHLHSRRKSR